MQNLTFLYDEPQEAGWFRALHPYLQDADEQPITAARSVPEIQQVLAYDRPDIILLHNHRPILVIEETVEVPSGHNVGQRFARLAAAAERHVPCLYFGPYVAKKHGGRTAGPRYMNVRLFHALDVLIRATNTAVTTIKWPVDARYEVRRDPDKDREVREYMETFFNAYTSEGLPRVNAALLTSAIHRRLIRERNDFVSTSIKNPEQYNRPPPSVKILSVQDFMTKHRISTEIRFPDVRTEVVLYRVGMTYIRSDPYVGMAMLYRYLYLVEHRSRAHILHFPHITRSMWRTAANNSNRKDIKLFRITADAILFSDGLLLRSEL